MPPEFGPPSTEDAARLWDMLAAAHEVEFFARRRDYESFLQDRLFRLAIERLLEIIGEAARNISRSFQDAHPHIPWTPIIVQRHRLVHEYGEIREELIWKVVTVHIPALIANLEPLVPPPPLD